VKGEVDTEIKINLDLNSITLQKNSWRTKENFNKDRRNFSK